MYDYNGRNLGTIAWFVVAAGICIIFLIISIYLHNRTGVEYSFLYRDANAISSNPFYYGILESLTAILLISSGAIMTFTAWGETWKNKSFLYFCALMGLLTIVMGIDDLLMLHESVWFVHWRLKEIHVYIIYAAILFFSIGYYRKTFLLTPFLLFIASIFFLTIAGVDDKLEIEYLHEDYLEIIGFSLWFCYIISSSLSLKNWNARKFLSM